MRSRRKEGGGAQTPAAFSICVYFEGVGRISDFGAIEAVAARLDLRARVIATDGRKWGELNGRSSVLAHTQPMSGSFR